jgi:two-component system nitrogen regulation response regulator NtrX
VDVRVESPPPTRTADRDPRGRFREDLYFRLNVIPIFVPPCANRDTTPSCSNQHFIAEFPARTAAGRSTWTRREPRGAQLPLAGNVRDSATSRAAHESRCLGDTITPAELAFLEGSGTIGGRTGKGPGPAAARSARNRFEREYILRALRRHNGNISAHRPTTLGVERATCTGRCEPSGSFRRVVEGRGCLKKSYRRGQEFRRNSSCS